jgi:RNA polymerase sigma factor (TIGR02999 family)
MADDSRSLPAPDQDAPRPAAELLPLVYGELRKLAAQRLAQEKPGHTLQPTALVHEAYLRLVGQDADQPWDGRGHFFAAAAEAMRRILVDHARRRGSQKRGGGGTRVSLDPDCLPAADLDADVLTVHDALGRLAAIEPKVAELVTLRYFGGLTISQAAEVQGVAPRTAYAWWAYARAWLAADLGR